MFQRTRCHVSPLYTAILVVAVVVHLVAAAIGPPFESRIVGGMPATQSARLPHVVSLLLFRQHVCGGSIIGERTVLTAAHCLAYATPRLMQVHAGAHTHALAEGVLIPVRSLHRHDGWTADTMDYDIGVVRLLWSFVFSATITPIRLPMASDTLTQPPVGALATVAGWGLTSIDGPESNELRYAHVPIIAQERCEELLPDAISPRMLCAGYEQGGIDACQQDSGGPLELDGSLVGIVSWGVGCALPDKPGVYTRVATLIPWLQKLIKDVYGDRL